MYRKCPEHPDIRAIMATGYPYRMHISRRILEEEYNGNADSGTEEKCIGLLRMRRKQKESARLE